MLQNWFKYIGFLGILTASFFVDTALISAQTPGEVAGFYNAGNEAYREKKFIDAIEQYLQAVDEGGVSADLYYNLGSAYFRAGSLGQAILWFERARIIAPRDDDIANNLAFARKLTQDKIESIYRGWFVTWFIRFIETISFQAFRRLLLILSFLATLATIYAILQLRARWIAIILWILFLAMLGGWYFKGNRIWERNLAIVLSPKVDARSAPDEDSELLFTIHEGTRIAIKETRGTWYRITLEDGHTGWARQEVIQKVITGKDL